MADEKKGNDKRPMPRGFISLGKKKPYVSSGTSGSVTLVLPKDVLESVGYEPGDEIEMFRNRHDDLMIRFQRKE